MNFPLTGLYYYPPHPKKKPYWLWIIIALLLLLWVRLGRAEEICIPCIIEIESGNNPDAYNPKSQARGLMQITPACLKEFVEFNNVIYADPDYLFNPAFNIKVAQWYLNRIRDHYCKVWNIPPTIDHILIGYRDGVKNLKKYIEGKRKLGKEMKIYLKKYHQLTKEK